ncbi:MAG: TraR/DksA C4-type zinc finger protein [Pseudomonadota bacterium]
MHRDDLTRLLETLVDKRVALQRYIASLDTPSASTDTRKLHSAPANIDDAVIDALVREMIRELGQLNAALVRAKSGQLGICATCQQRINNKRLRAMPFAEHCARCANTHDES